MSAGPITVSEIQQALPNGVTIQALLDSGGQGSVFSGICNGNPSAIKIVNPATTEDKRVEREIRFLKSVSHPHIVKLIENYSIEIRGTKCQVLAYEFIERGDLSKNLASGQLPTGSEIIRLGKSIGSAIHVLWSARERVVHRDIKPKNIMVRSSGEYVLVDFGLARHIDLSDITIIGSPGTPGFRSPEQALGWKNLTFKSDVFSLGVTLFVFATGRHPFNRQQAFPQTKITFDIFNLRSDLDPKLLKGIISMLKPSAVDRPSDISGLFTTLEV